MATIPTFTDGGVLHASQLNFMLDRVRCSYFRSANQSFTTSVGAMVSGDTLFFDTDPTSWAASPNPTRLTLNTAGTWLLIGCINWAGNATGTRLLTISKNSAGTYGGGTTLLSVSQLAVVATQNTVQILTYCVPGFVAGDYLEMAGWQNSGGTLTMTGFLQAIWIGL